MKVGFLCKHNPYDRQAFSGTAYYSARALMSHPELQLEILGPHRPLPPWHRLTRRLFSPPVVRTDRLDIAHLDAVIGVVATGLVDDLLPRGVPMIHVTDSTVVFQREFYGKDIPADAGKLEARVVSQATRTVFSSQFMADLAVSEYGLPDQDRLAVVPFGVNLDALPETYSEKPPPAPLRLLYVGVDWERKGGALAVATVDALRSQGHDVELTVVGPSPDLGGHAGVSAAGYLDKNNPQHLARLTELFRTAHLFILPTRADCTPMVVAEANAYGTPVLITETGGIPTLMAEGRNGAMVPPDAGRDDWAQAVLRLTEAPDRYAELSAASFAHAHARLTWKAWADDMVSILREVTAH